ncbi:hypothetical protein [Rhizobium sp. LjRoot254]|uniref:hypothetical protein n=1 Tax=Rhizobium sp. LjRoot254 TaxID=3342297 RepID=UPI003ECF1791
MERPASGEVPGGAGMCSRVARASIHSFARSCSTITDFDARGGIGKQDFIDINGTAFDIERSGRNTLVTVLGDETLLIGIKPRDIDASDFI